MLNIPLRKQQQALPSSGQPQQMVHFSKLNQHQQNQGSLTQRQNATGMIIGQEQHSKAQQMKRTSPTKKEYRSISHVPSTTQSVRTSVISLINNGERQAIGSDKKKPAQQQSIQFKMKSNQSQPQLLAGTSALDGYLHYFKPKQDKTQDKPNSNLTLTSSAQPFFIRRPLSSLPPAPKFSELIPQSKIDLEDSDIEEISLEEMRLSKNESSQMEEKKLIGRFASKTRGSMQILDQGEIQFVPQQETNFSEVPKFQHQHSSQTQQPTPLRNKEGSNHQSVKSRPGIGQTEKNIPKQDQVIESPTQKSESVAAQVAKMLQHYPADGVTTTSARSDANTIKIKQEFPSTTVKQHLVQEKDEKDVQIEQLQRQYLEIKKQLDRLQQEKSSPSLQNGDPQSLEKVHKYDLESSFAHDKKQMASKIKGRRSRKLTGALNQGLKDTRDDEDDMASLSLSKTISDQESSPPKQKGGRLTPGISESVRREMETPQSQIKSRANAHRRHKSKILQAANNSINEEPCHSHRPKSNSYSLQNNYGKPSSMRETEIAPQSQNDLVKSTQQLAYLNQQLIMNYAGMLQQQQPILYGGQPAFSMYPPPPAMMPTYYGGGQMPFMGIPGMLHPPPFINQQPFQMIQQPTMMGSGFVQGVNYSYPANQGGADYINQPLQTSRSADYFSVSSAHKGPTAVAVGESIVNFTPRSNQGIQQNNARRDLSLNFQSTPKHHQDLLYKRKQNSPANNIFGRENCDIEDNIPPRDRDEMYQSPKIFVESLLSEKI